MEAIAQQTAKNIDKTALKVQQKYRAKVRPFSDRTRPTFNRKTEVHDDFSIESEVIAREKRVRKKVFFWLLRGTKAHVIRAAGDAYFHIQVGIYSPKRFGGTGAVSNPQWVTVKEFHHPGIEPWGIEEEFRKESIPELKEGINKGIITGLRKSG